MSINNNTNLLKLMLEDESQQPEIYRPGPYWRGYQSRIVAAIERHGITKFRSVQSICKGFADPGLILPETMWTGWKGSVRTSLISAPVINRIVDQYRRALAAEHQRRCRTAANWYGLALDNLDFPDTMTAGGNDGIDIAGRTISGQYLECALRMQTFGVDFGSVHTVMEIGGGFGCFPHLAMHRFANIKHVVYIDIPPMIYIATQYLKQFFNVRDYAETRDLTTIALSDDREILCLCPWQIERLDCAIDLLWNTASFSEMPGAVVTNYAAHIQPKSVCLLLNKDEDSGGKSSVKSVLDAFGGGFRRIATPFASSPYFCKP